MATGRSNDEIAAELVVSPPTVRTHVSRAMLELPGARPGASGGVRDRVRPAGRPLIRPGRRRSG
ncbi:LuxR C-terminal-related transcriptional regulator [Geodermatophilus sp. SYSU D00815]